MAVLGVEVKSGESLKVDPGYDKIVHLSMACLGEVSKDKGSEPVSLYVKFDDQKLALGTLSSEKFPQISYDLVFEKEFELSHNWKHGSVYFNGYKAEAQVKNNVKPDADQAKQKQKIADPRKNAKAKEKDAGVVKKEDSSESESDEDSSEDENICDYYSSVLLSGVHFVVRIFVLLSSHDMSGTSSGVHVATPHPSKQAGKAAASSSQPAKQQTPKSGGEYSCEPCKRSFKTEDALSSHNKAKHSVK
ncbi:hypothetical protein RIF29_39801 [Crotalaria pallida]|uniref:C2H2-type domain-containing protein n=1 Tax=Crotalaria pallida TaxID=3830 RepID=A0AAN9E881_CROPI